MKFEIGDVVRVHGIEHGYAEQFNGDIGIVKDFQPGEVFPVEVELTHRLIKARRAFKESELEKWPLPFVEEVAPGVDEDDVNHPSHYTWLPNGFEVIDMAEHLGFNLGNVVKYTARAGRKTDDSLKDLLKAQWYLDREINRLSKEN